MSIDKVETYAGVGWQRMSVVEPTPKLLNILYACANGRLPWWTPDDGASWNTALPLCDELFDDDTGEEYTGYVLCCGHTLSYPTESSAVVGAGLMLPGRARSLRSANAHDHQGRSAVP